MRKKKHSQTAAAQLAVPPWLTGGGTDSDIILSTRIRLARNIAGYPFPCRMTNADRETVRKQMSAVLAEQNTVRYDLEATKKLDILCLLERQMISKELAEAETVRSVFVAEDESFAVMVNEEDHLRIHSLTGGFEPDKVWETVNRIDDIVSGQTDYSFHKQYGYLTSCPTNAGTAMRVSVMMHLPALAMTKETDATFRSLQKANLAVRGLYGEGTQAYGDLFQISNQITLGVCESAVISEMRRVIPQLIEREHKARISLLLGKPQFLRDRCCRALGVLQTAYTMETAEALYLLSLLRLGIHLELLDEIGNERKTAFSAAEYSDTINRLLLWTQPAHLQKYTGETLEQTARDTARATLIRKTIG